MQELELVSLVSPLFILPAKNTNTPANLPAFSEQTTWELRLGSCKAADTSFNARMHASNHLYGGKGCKLRQPVIMLVYLTT
jgi:hypothetical protein